MESELDRSYLDKASEITGLGYLDAYNKAQQQFNAEQNLAMQAQNQTNVYGLNALQRQADLGGQQRGIEAEGIAADKEQFDLLVTHWYSVRFLRHRGESGVDGGDVCDNPRRCGLGDVPREPER